MDALTLNYWLSIFFQEVAKCSKDPYPPKTLYQIVCGICRFMVQKNPAIEFNPLESSDKRCVNWNYWRGGPFDILKLRKLHRTFLFSLQDLLSLDERKVIHVTRMGRSGSLSNEDANVMPRLVTTFLG